MHSFFSTAIAALAIALPVSSLSPRAPQSSISQGTILKPIAIRDFEAATGLQRREDSEKLSDLDTKTQAELIYGSPGENGQLTLANMTLYAEDGLEIVMMERFEGLTSAVDCQGDDGQMSLTFSSQDAYKYALKQWDYINQSDDGTFLLIANHDGCGPDGERQAYYITKVTEDDASLTTLLTAKTAPWEDVTGTFDLDFGQITPYAHTPQLKERGFLDDLGDDLVGNWEFSKTATFDVSAGTKGQVSNIYSGDKFKLDCINCFTTGSFALTGHLSTHHFSLKALTLAATPQNFQAELELQAKITATASPASLQYEKQLFSFPVPGAGISIPKILNLGATLSYDVGITTTFQGTATVDFGVSAGIPNTAQLIADLKNPDKSSATGFGGGSLTPLFDVKDVSASVTLGAYSKPKLAFGLEITKIGTATVDIGVKLPEVDVTLTAAYNEAGVCTGNPSTTGVKLDSKLDIEVDLDVTAKLGDSAVPSWSKPLFAFTQPLVAQCFPLQIPGLKPAKTAIPTLSSTLASTQPPTVTVTPVYSASGVSATPIVSGSSFVIAPSGVSIPSSVTALPSAPIGTGSSYIVGPSGSGGIPLSSGNPPYPYSSGASGVATGTGGTSGVPVSSGSPPHPYSSGVSGPATGTGGIPVSSGNPPYPYSTGVSGAASAAGGGSAAAYSGYISTSGRFASGTVSAPDFSASETPSASRISVSASGTSAAPSSTGTATIMRRSNQMLKWPLMPRAAAGSESKGCMMAKGFGKRVLVC